MSGHHTSGQHSVLSLSLQMKDFLVSRWRHCWVFCFYSKDFHASRRMNICCKVFAVVVEENSSRINVVLCKEVPYIYNSAMYVHHSPAISTVCSFRVLWRVLLPKETECYTFYVGAPFYYAILWYIFTRFVGHLGGNCCINMECSLWWGCIDNYCSGFIKGFHVSIVVPSEVSIVVCMVRTLR